MADGTATTESTKGLSPMREAFVQAYLGSARFNASEAARQAGYKKAGQQGHDLLKIPEIALRVKEELESLALTAEQNLTLVRDDALKSDEEIISMAAKAFKDAGIPAGASMISSLVTARTTARTNLLRVHGNLSSRLDVKHSGRVDHVHRIPQGLHNLSDAELASLEAIALKAQDAELVTS